MLCIGNCRLDGGKSGIEKAMIHTLLHYLRNWMDGQTGKT